MKQFANNITKEDQLYELEDLIHRFRRTPRTVAMMSSTPHAVIRSYLQFDKADALLKVLEDKNSYGVFPDVYCCNILLDHFISSKQYKDAVQIAISMMLQEDPGDEISKVLALYACHKYLQGNILPTYVEQEKIPEEDVDEDDVQWVRVHFLRKDFYDDHFDIKDETLLTGKTLWMFGQQLDDSVGLSYQLLGLAMYQKWPKVINLLGHILNDKDKILTDDVVQKFKTYFSEAQNLDSDSRNVISEKLENIISSDRVKSDDIDAVFEKKLAEVSKNESVAREDQIRTYSKWEENRKMELKAQIDEYVRQERLKKVIGKKKELKDKEDLLYFFENFQKLQKELPQEVEKARKDTKHDEEYQVPEMPHPGYKSGN